MTYPQAMRWLNTQADAWQRARMNLRFMALAQMEISPAMSNREVTCLARDLFAQACGEVAYERAA